MIVQTESKSHRRELLIVLSVNENESNKSHYTVGLLGDEKLAEVSSLSVFSLASSFSEMIDSGVAW